MNAAELEHYSTTTENNPLQLVKFEEFEQMYSCKIKIAVCKFRSIYRCVCVCVPTKEDYNMTKVWWIMVEG